MLAPKLPNFSFCAIKKTKKHNFFLKMTFFIFFFKISFHIALGGMNTEFEDPSSNIANFQFLCYKKH